MADIQHYERVIKKQKGVITSRILWILAYAFILSLWVVISARIGFSLTAIALAVLSVVIAVIITWKYTKVEYEYSFIAGTFTFSRIYGSRKRKAVFEADLKTLVSAIPYGNGSRLPQKGEYDLVNAVPDGASQNPCICFFDDGNKNKHCIIIDCDLMTLKILRFFKVSAVDRDLSKLIEKENDDA